MVAIVTGGSRGIGKAITEALLKIDYSVIVTARNETDDIKKLKEIYVGKVFFVPCDISSEDDRKSLFNFANDNFGKLDLLVNNAGVASQVSFSAGAYVCNDLLYTLLAHFEGSQTRVGFIHIPYCKEQSKEPAMEISEMVKGLTVPIENIDT